MGWVKTKRGPQTVYLAPPDVYPMIAVVYTPQAVTKWAVEYANFGDNAVTVAQVESLMGL